MARAKTRKVFTGKTRDEAIKYIKYISGKANEMSKKHSEMLDINSSYLMSELEKLGAHFSTKRAERIDTLGGLTKTNKDGRTVLSATKKLENLSDKDLIKYAQGLSNVMNKERYSSKKAFKTYLNDRLDKSMNTLATNNNMTLEELKNIVGKDYYRFCLDVFSGGREDGWSSDEAFNTALQSYTDVLNEPFKEQLNIRLENIKKERELISRGKMVR